MNVNKPMNWHEANKLLKKGHPLRLDNWANGTFIYSQKHTEVSIKFIENMSSVSEKVKGLLIYRKTPLKFEYQLNIVDENNIITGFTPNIEQLNAVNWVILKVGN